MKIHYIIGLLFFTINLQGQFDFQELILENGDYFEEDSKIVTLTLGVGSDVDLDSVLQSRDRLSPKVSIPSIRLEFEKQVYNNLGLSISTNYRQWRIPTFEYKFHYVSTSIMGHYHFNITDNLHPYFGIGTTYRRMMASNEINTNGKGNISLGYSLGVRYYLTPELGITVSFGNNSISPFHIGGAIYFQ